MIESAINDCFWTKGNGKDFVEWSGVNLESGNFDKNLFYKYDQPVDELVEKWLKNGDFKKIMRSLHQTDDLQDLPQDFIDLKKELEDIPAWLDKDLLHHGCELSERSGLIGLLVLRNFALLGGYNFANLTKPLIATGSLEKGAVHRLYNTLSFWVDVSRTDYDSQKLRINACVRTRLVHSASRLMIKEKMPQWDSEKYGIPINFADMIATNIAFTVYYLFGLDQLSFNYTRKEEEGIFHLWKYVTWLLGVPLEIIPENKKEAVMFFKFWTKFQGAPDEDSQKLTDSLLNENTPVSLLKLDIIKRNMGYIHKSIANYLIDPEIRSNLNIPTVRFKNVIPHALKLKNEIKTDLRSQMLRGNLEQKSVLEDYKNNI